MKRVDNVEKLEAGKCCKERSQRVVEPEVGPEVEPEDAALAAMKKVDGVATVKKMDGGADVATFRCAWVKKISDVDAAKAILPAGCR